MPTLLGCLGGPAAIEATGWAGGSKGTQYPLLGAMAWGMGSRCWCGDPASRFMPGEPDEGDLAMTAWLPIFQFVSPL